MLWLPYTVVTRIKEDQAWDALAQGPAQSQHGGVTESVLRGVRCPTAASSGGEHGRARVALPRRVRHVGGVTVPYQG